MGSLMWHIRSSRVCADLSIQAGMSASAAALITEGPLPCHRAPGQLQRAGAPRRRPAPADPGGPNAWQGQSFWRFWPCRLGLAAGWLAP